MEAREMMNAAVTMSKENRTRLHNNQEFLGYFIEELSGNTELLQRLVEAADREANKHQLGDRAYHATDDDKGHCEDCRDDSSEHDDWARKAQILADIWDLAFESWKRAHPNGFSSDEGSDDAIEPVNSEDDIEEQDPDGNYIKKRS